MRTVALALALALIAPSAQAGKSDDTGVIPRMGQFQQLGQRLGRQVKFRTYRNGQDLTVGLAEFVNCFIEHFAEETLKRAGKDARELRKLNHDVAILVTGLTRAAAKELEAGQKLFADRRSFQLNASVRERIVKAGYEYYADRVGRYRLVSAYVIVGGAGGGATSHKKVTEKRYY